MADHAHILKNLKKESNVSLRYLMLFSLLTNLLMLAPAIYSLQVLDRVLSSGSYETLAMLSVIMIFCVIFYGYFSMLRSRIAQHLANWLERKLSPEIMPLSIDLSAQGILPEQSRGMRDIQTIKSLIASPTIQILFDAPWAPIFLIIITLIHPLLGAVTLIGGLVLLTLAWLNDVTTKKLSEKSTVEQGKAALFNTAVHQQANMIQAMGMSGYIQAHYQTLEYPAQTAQQYFSDRQNILSNSSRTFRLFLQLCITGVGAVLTMQHDLSVGGMIASSILAGRALVPFDGAINLWKAILQSKEAYGRLCTMLEKKLPERGTTDLPTPKGKLSVETVRYGFAGSQKPILHSLNFILEPGTHLGLIGPSGTGKSTLANLLAGVTLPSHGDVRLDGMSLYHWKRESVGNFVGYLPQNVGFLPGTIAQNISRFNPEADDKIITAAAQMAGVHDVIIRLPHGYDTIVGGDQRTVSPGQMQRIALARALYSAPRLVILDEPNAHLDGEGDAALLQTLQRLKKVGVTVVMITHKPSLVRTMDKILVLKDGTMQQFGDREEVLSKMTKQASSMAQQETVTAPATIEKKPRSKKPAKNNKEKS